MSTSHDEPERPIVVYAAMAANLGIAVAKFVAAALTGSSSMISEGVHSLVDTGNQALLLVGLGRARRPADAEHPFGHGKELYFWSLIVAIVIFGVGGGVSIYEGITHILHPAPLEDPSIAYLVLLIAFFMEGGSWIVAFREISQEAEPGEGVVHTVRTSKDPSVITVLLEDSAALLGLVVAALGVFLSHTFEEPRIDGLGSLVIGGLLAAVAVFLASESRGLLVGERADPELTDRLRTVAEADAEVQAIEDIRSMHLGPDHVVVTLRVRFAGDAGDRLAAVIERVEGRLRAEDPRLGDITMQPVGTSPSEPKLALAGPDEDHEAP
jgi:cation diffusion facilitator family transporter